MVSHNAALSEDLTGKKFGRLTVIEKAQPPPNVKTTQAYWLCECDCGSTKIVFGYSLKNGDTCSCGCYRKEKMKQRAKSIHGCSNTRIYQIWADIKMRCYNSKCCDYKYYGERNIKMCNQWFNSFQDFYKWALNNGYDDTLTIERIDVNKDYTPDNCRWATMKEQGNNRRNNARYTYNNKSQTLSEWSQELGICYPTLSARLNKLGWGVERAFSTSVLGGDNTA